MSVAASLAAAARAAAATRLGEVPVAPDAEEARRWAEEELARGIYAQRQGLLERFLLWLDEWLARLAALGSDGPPWLLAVVVVLVTGTAVALALLVAGPVRRRRAAASSAAVFGDDERTAADLRAAADVAAAAGDHATAVVERFRAVIRALTERALLEDRPGLTADEAARGAGGRLPSLAEDLAAAAALFDAVLYGRRSVGPREDDGLRELDARVAATRPTAASHGVRA